MCREAYCTTGASPILSFNVPDLQDTLTRLLALGGRMDGRIHHTIHGKVRANGHWGYQDAGTVDGYDNISI